MFSKQIKMNSLIRDVTLTIGFLLGLVSGCERKNRGEIEPPNPKQAVVCSFDIKQQLTSNLDTKFDLLISRKQEKFRMVRSHLSGDVLDSAAEKNTAANELFSLPELPDGVVSDLAQMAESADEDEVWRDYCLQFLGSALEREDGVTDEDRALARETLVEALASTNATFAGTALRALHRGDPADPLVAESALRIARDPTYPSSSRTAALLILEDGLRVTSSTLQPFNPSTLAETAAAVSADPAASSLLRQTAEAVLKRLAPKTPNP